MARKKKAAVEEYTGSVYGIDKDGNVASVSIYRKGSNIRLSRMFGDGRMFPHSITHPTSVVAEAALVYELTDPFEINRIMEDSVGGKHEIAKLEEKAAKLRAEKGNKPGN